MTYPHLIGLSGKAGSGKSEAGAYLVRAHGYQPLAFADYPKWLLGQAFGFSSAQLYGPLKETNDPRFGKSPRYCLQYLLEACRHCWPEIWIKHLAEKLESYRAMGLERFVITDVRLFLEAKYLYGQEGKLVRIERAGAGALNGIPGHHTETELDAWAPWDLLLYNNGSLEDLETALDKWLGIIQEDVP